MNALAKALVSRTTGSFGDLNPVLMPLNMHSPQPGIIAVNQGIGQPLTKSLL